jgi:hypothetical protein
VERSTNGESRGREESRDGKVGDVHKIIRMICIIRCGNDSACQENQG